MKARDITGQRFGQLTAIRRVENQPPYKQARWLFLCDCGQETVQFGYTVWHNKVVSCGCYKRALRPRLSHGMNGTREYRAWTAMRARCLCKTDRAYPLYGGRGITICKRWMRFENFYTDMGPKPVGMSLDRIDNDAGYSSGNCRWATPVQQVRNRRPTIYCVYNERRRPLKAWCEMLKLPYPTIWHRHKLGLRGGALFGPVRKQHPFRNPAP